MAAVIFIDRQYMYFKLQYLPDMHFQIFNLRNILGLKFLFLTGFYLTGPLFSWKGSLLSSKS